MSHPHIDVERRIAADPTSAVLLMAAPAAAELWPGVRLAAADPGEHLRVSVTLPTAAAELAGLHEPIDAVIRAEPPQRTPTAFIVHFSFDAADVPATTGTLTLAYTPGADDQTNGTMARLHFTVSDAFAAPGFLDALQLSARTFLGNLATAAEERARAA